MFTEMSGNGCRIVGIVTIPAHQQMEVHGKEVARTASFVAVAGATAPGAAVRRFATVAFRTTATTALASAS